MPDPTIEVASYAAAPSRQLDILFQIDGTNGGELWQLGLAASFQRLVDSLSTLDGGLPDLHIGIVSSDLGTSGTMGDPAPAIGSVGQGGCAGRGDDGALLVINNAPVMGTFLIDEDDGGLRRRNYTGSIAEAFRQMVLLGAGDCGFEQPLAATMRAFTNDANVGFSRPDANLLVVIATDEDDCSIRDPAIVGPESASLGPQESFRCTRFGLVCDEPLDSPGMKTNCRAREDSPYIEGVAAFVDRMKTLRGDHARVAVAAIAGPPITGPHPFDAHPIPRGIEIALRTPTGDDPHLALEHGCRREGQTGTNVADPAVRIAQAVDELAPNSSFDSVCTNDFDAIVDNIARTTRGLYGITCLDSSRVGAAPACSVIVESPDGETPLSLCPAAGDCFEIVEDTAVCGDRPRLVVHLAAPAADQFVRARCVLTD